MHNPTRRFHAIHGFRRLTACVATFVLCVSSSVSVSVRAADEEAKPVPADAVDTSFEDLQTTIKNLKDSGEAINASLARCNTYLDTLGSSPTKVAGKDLQAAFGEIPNLKLQDWNSLITANKPKVTDLLLKDSVVRQTMRDIQKEVVRIKTDIEQIEPQAKKVGDQAKLLGDELKKMIKDQPWKSFSKGPMVMKLGGVVKDSTEVVQVAQKSLRGCGEVIGKLGVATSFLPVTDPLVNELATIEAAKPTTETAQVEPVLLGGGGGATKITTSEGGSKVLSTGFEGFWLEDRSSGPQVRLLLGSPRAGQACGFVLVSQPGFEKQAALVLREADAEQQVYVDAGSGTTFKINPFKDQLILEVGKPGGDSDRYFMKRL